MKVIFFFIAIMSAGCLKSNKANVSFRNAVQTDSLKVVLAEINRSEQEPIRSRDSLIAIYGAESAEANALQVIYKKNHAINEQKVKEILSQYGWPSADLIGEQGSRTICNVIQHSDNAVRLKYLPMMQTAVQDGNLDPSLLARAEDRIATERGDLQIYGGQMKYYPETKSFNVWPVYDPANIDKRRAAIGLNPIAEYLKSRFNFDWNLEEQIKRAAEFEEAKEKKD